jgi:hypothetical protein
MWARSFSGAFEALESIEWKAKRGNELSATRRLLHRSFSVTDGFPLVAWAGCGRCRRAGCRGSTCCWT